MAEVSFWDFVKRKRDYPGAGYLEIRPDWRERLPREVGASGLLMRKVLAGASTVLDVGAGTRYYEQVLNGLGLGPKYFSVDNDGESGNHDYDDFLSVDRRFDAVLMFELIEHIPADLGIRFMQHARLILNPGGVLLMSTPNSHHPNHIWRASVTHIRPWPADDLYGALQYCGFGTVQVFRQYIAWPRRRIIKPLTKLLYKVMELDHAQGLFCVAWNDRSEHEGVHRPHA